MNKMLTNFTPDSEVFGPGTRRTLADVRAVCETALDGSALRDTRSAFRFLAGPAGVDLGATLAQPDELRRLFAGLSAARFGVSEKRLANIRALVASAVWRFGMARTWVTREIAPDPVWAELLERIPKCEHRWGLSRLACYCTVKGIRPEEVDRETLLGLFAALEAEEVCKKPRGLLKHTIALWNMCRRAVPGWPPTVLSSPFKTEPFTLPLEAFPAGFREGVAAFEARMQNPDPLDPRAPVRALPTPPSPGGATSSPSATR